MQVREVRTLRSSLIVLILILSGPMCFMQLPAQSTAETADVSWRWICSAHETHEPVLIASDDDFVSQSWPGAGTPDDPYVVEGLSIDAAKGGHCIEIRNVRAHFTVKNCLLGHHGDEWTGGTHASTGVRFFNVTHGAAENNILTGNGVGIYILMSNNSVIFGNNFSAIADDPIISAVSSHVTISGNVCGGDSFSIDVTDDGHDYSPELEISESYSGSYNGINITSNLCVADSLGLVISGCTSGTIRNNTAYGNDRYWDTDSEGALTLGANFAIRESQNLVLTNNTGRAKGVCISVSGGRNITVTWNSFTSYEFHPAYDESRLALFDYNYYSDYDGEDADNDGIGDTPYSDLYGYIYDEHPLMFYPWSSPATDQGVLLLVIAGVVVGVVCIIVITLTFRMRRR